MAWINPKVNWHTPAYPDYTDYNRIEGNTLELKKAATIDVADAGGYLASTNLEAALAELHQMCR